MLLALAATLPALAQSEPEKSLYEAAKKEGSLTWYSGVMDQALCEKVGKAFTATLLAQAVKQGDVSLDDPVAKYVTELGEDGDIRSVTLRQLASHTSGLDRSPHQSEPWHRGPYTLPDFIRYLNAWKADEAHIPGKQDIYSNSGFVLLALALSAHGPPRLRGIDRSREVEGPGLPLRRAAAPAAAPTLRSGK